VDLVGVEQVLVENQVPGEVLADAHRGEDDAGGRNRRQDETEDPLRPADLDQQREQDAEGNEEEAGVLDRVRDVLGIRALDRVENQGRCEGPPQPSDRGILRGGINGFRLRRRRPRRGEEAGCDHQIEGNQEVRGLIPELQRHPKPDRGEDGGRKCPVEATKHRSEAGHRDRRTDACHSELERLRAQLDDPLLVPDVARDQRRS
jgi:hypothetical protein